MDDSSRRGRQNEAPGHPSSSSRRPLHHLSSPHRPSIPHLAAESYRPPPAPAPAPSPLQIQQQQQQQPQQANPPASTPRGIASVGGSYSTYYQEPATAFSTPNMSSTAMAYGQEYGADGRNQSQSFSSYGAGLMMYNVGQSNPQPPAVYDAQSFATRHHPAIQMISPDVSSTYFASDTGPVSATPNLQSPAPASSVTSAAYSQQGPAPVNYGVGIASANTLASSQAAMAEDQQYSRNSALEEKWTSYQRQLGIVFQDITNGSLESASEMLLSLSNWLLTQVVDLGLSQDDSNLHADRIRLWNDFNHAWLALGFRQKELMESGEPLSRSQSLVSEEMIKKMGDDLIRLCDTIEPHGLVDYQYGVWEEQIEIILEECLDLYDSTRGSGSTGGTR